MGLGSTSQSRITADRLKKINQELEEPIREYERGGILVYWEKRSGLPTFTCSLFARVDYKFHGGGVGSVSSLCAAPGWAQGWPVESAQ